LAKASLTKSKKRVKDLGEVFTPPELVQEMLDRLDPSVWHPDRTFLDPSCGNGNFLVAVVQRKVQTGSTPLQALRTTFGIDIMADNVGECRERILEAVGKPHGGVEAVERNIRCADSLAIDWESAFDAPA
jgi:23S rRNA G2445 N2-methylase RlmL